jgi:predicted O-methyltransferase YrrM
MTADLWASVDSYLAGTMRLDDPIFDHVIRSTDDAGLPQIGVSAPQGKMLHLFVQMIGAQRILEIGTLAGYSAIWMAKALPKDGRLVTLEIDPKHAGVARDNVALAGLSNVVEIRVGRALDTLPQLDGAFDLMFVDADKVNIPAYFEWCLKLSHSGSVIVVDNVVRNGAVIDPNGDDAVQGVRRLNEMVARERRVSATTIQTVGSKGYDGFTLIRVE